MQNKTKTVLLILSAFIFGFIFFGVLNSSSKQTKNMNTSKDTETKQPETTKTPDIAKNKTLNLSGQRLEKLPASALTSTDLEELNISNNKMTGALPSEIGKLTKLKVLNASNNLMTGVPAEIGHLSDLEVLDLSNNKLTGLPNELAGLKKLKILNLSGNKYSEQDLAIIKKGLSSEVNIIL